MATKKNTAKTEFGISEARKKELLSIASRSGSPLKVATVRGGGVYPVPEKDTGTGILVRAAFARAIAESGKENPPVSAVSAALASIIAGAKESPAEYRKIFDIRNVRGRSGRGYSNYSGVRRILGEIREGRIVGFDASETARKDGAKLSAAFAKALPKK